MLNKLLNFAQFNQHTWNSKTPNADCLDCIRQRQFT